MLMSYIQGMKKSSINDLMMNAWFISLYIWQGLIIIPKYICIPMLVTIYDCNIFHYVYILSLVIVFLKMYIISWVYKNKLVYRGFSRVCCKCTWFLVFKWQVQTQRTHGVSARWLALQILRATHKLWSLYYK